MIGKNVSGWVGGWVGGWVDVLTLGPLRSISWMGIAMMVWAAVLKPLERES